MLLLSTPIRESEVDFDGPARDVWLGVLLTAARAGSLRELVDAVLYDPSVAAYHPALRQLRDGPSAPAPAPAPTSAPPEPTPAPVPASAPAGASWTAFLCHSSGDKEEVRALYQRLTADGVTCWFDNEVLLPGQDWDLEISRAIRASRYVLVCCPGRRSTRPGTSRRSCAGRSTARTSSPRAPPSSSRCGSRTA